MREKKEKCIFYNAELQKRGVNPCNGMMTKHHVHYKCEGGADKPNNLVPMCQGHQRFVHSKDIWGDEDFSYLKRRV